MDQALVVDEFDYDSLPDHTRQKRLAVVLLLVTAALSPLLSIVLPMPLNMIVSSLFINVLVMTWVYFDSLELGDPIGGGMRIGVMLLGLVMVVPYFYRSRGGKYGTIALARMIGLGVIILFLETATNLLLAYFHLIKL